MDIISSSEKMFKLPKGIEHMLSVHFFLDAQVDRDLGRLRPEHSLRAPNKTIDKCSWMEHNQNIDSRGSFMQLTRQQAQELGEAILDAVQGIAYMGDDYVIISLDDYGRVVALPDVPDNEGYDYDIVMRITA